MNRLNTDFYMPAEWHPHTQCWMAWPCHLATWSNITLERAEKAYAHVAQAISEFEPVTMLVNPDQYDRAASLCSSNIRLISQPIDDSWTRDTGPTFLINASGELAGIDWLHNAWGGNYEYYERDKQIAKKIIQESKAKYLHAPLIMEGGSFHVDGEGTVLTTRECLLNTNRNPQLSQTQIEDYLCQFLNASKVIWLDKGLIDDETNGHIDEIACFIAPGKVLALITNDTQDVNYSILQDNLRTLRAAKDAKGRLLEVHTVEQPPATHVNGIRLTLSYINFYMANQGIILPAFGHPEYDKAAYDLFVKLFPDCKIRQIDALDIFTGGGGIHCITQQQPA